MTRNLNKELKKYYRDIGKALSGSKEKKSILAQIKSSVNNYLEENQNATISDVVNRIGIPEQIADEYIDNQSNDEISAKSLFRISPHASCLHIFRHILPKSSLIHKVLPAVLAASGEKSYGA